MVRKIRESSFIKIFVPIAAHPLLLLVVGAIISSLVIPYYTRQWQDHQKELELKTDLTGEISEAVSDIIINARLIQSPAGFIDVNDLGKANIEWEKLKETIASKLQSYFPTTALKQRWIDLSNGITEFVNLSPSLSQQDLSYITKLCLRIEHVFVMQEYFSDGEKDNLNMSDINSYDCPERGIAGKSKTFFTPPLEGVDWNSLVHKEYINSSSEILYNNNWFKLERYFQDQKDKLLRDILASDIPVY